MDLGLQALNRTAASRGKYASGQLEGDTLRLATQYANEGAGKYIAGLQPYLGAATAATGGAAQGVGGLYGNLGNVAGQQGSNVSNVYGNVTSGLTNANNAEAQAEMQANKNLWEGVFGVAKMFSGAGGDKGAQVAKMAFG